MTSVETIGGGQASRYFLRRTILVLAVFACVLFVSAFTGLRFGLMLAIGLGFGMTLEGLSFGFAGPWRAMLLRRDPAGIWAQLLAIGIVTIVALPLIEANPIELMAASAPIGFAMVGGAFIFGVCMQIVLGCGSGTLVNAGSGNPIGLVALPFFALGSFAGAYHLFWWTDLGAIPFSNFTGWTGVYTTLALLATVAALLWWFSAAKNRRLPKRLIFAAIIIASLAILNLVVSGQPWGVVYGLGLWVAKAVTIAGADLLTSPFWQAPATLDRINASVLTDYTSLTNIGIIAGAFVIASWKSGGLSKKLPQHPLKTWIATIIAGFLLGYSSRLAFGCNVGAFFSGISTGSLHGWAWFIAAFAGSFYGIKLRSKLGFEVNV